MKWNALLAIFKRNFFSYFASPTGYVFICVFVLLCSLAAFWPPEFFNANLVNLEQLNKYLPYIMLVFIPAITMSIWAEERRQGTDELLLTIPASDLEVVLGKYLAAVAIFTAALLFSMVANFSVLRVLGRPDFGLFLATGFGYWMMGLAMLAVGMVASFLTGNLTVGFILGAIFNAPLVFFNNVDVIVKSREVAQTIRHWSLAERVADFERGVISLSSVSYFVMIIVVMIYLCMVLIGRRHWLGGRDGQSMLGHYLVRTLALVVLAVGVSTFFFHHDRRVDITTERLSSLSPDTRELIRNLDTDHPVVIEAFVSPSVPSEYVQTRLNLLAVLDELKSMGEGKISVQEYEVEEFSDEAKLAEDKHGIKPETVISRSRGAVTQEDVYLGVAFTCGLEKVVVPFVDKGLPAEYELIRSICTVVQPKRRKIGVVKTDARLFGQFDFQRMASGSDQLLIAELRKQYEVEEVDPSEPISDRYDCLLAVQPSSLTPPQLANLIDAVKSGQPTAIFEDPFPFPQFWSNVVGTDQPRRPPQQNPLMMMGRPPPTEPKGRITDLWDVLGIDLVGDEVIWQDYNPYPRHEAWLRPQWVIVSEGSGASEPFNASAPISSKLQQMLFIYPGAVRKLNSSKLEVTELAATNLETGTLSYGDAMEVYRLGPRSPKLTQWHDPTQERYIIGVHIRGKLPTDEDLFDLDAIDGGLGTDEPSGSSDDQAHHSAGETDRVCADDESDADGTDGAAPEAEGEKVAEGSTDGADDDPEINVVLVADIDCLGSAFFFLRASGADADPDQGFDFDNVTFLLNTLDVLAGDDRFVEIRKRRRRHRPLERVTERTEAARVEAADNREKFNTEFEKTQEAEQAKFDEQLAKLDRRTDLDPTEKQIRQAILRQDGQRRLDIQVAKLRQERDRDVKQIERDLALEIRRVQDGYKWRSLLLPPILPLLIGAFVFFHRRQQEREGVSRTRLK